MLSGFRNLQEQKGKVGIKDPWEDGSAVESGGAPGSCW